MSNGETCADRPHDPRKPDVRVVDWIALGRDGWCAPERTMRIETMYLRLRQPVELGHRIGRGCVTWLGGWDKQRFFYVVMVIRLKK